MPFAIYKWRRSAALLFCSTPIMVGLLFGAARAAEAGWRPYEVPPSITNPEKIPVALYYPTQAPMRSTVVGSFTVRATLMAAPEAKTKGLIVISHGTGGSEFGQSSLAEALARDGYLVAALRHPGDNYQDGSLWQKPLGAYFTERPRQLSRLIDALLADPEWKDRIATDANGPRIGAAGHSAGGYTVAALAGGRVDLSRIGTHCAKEASEDPITCGMIRDIRQMQAPLVLESTVDPRIRAIVAMAPVGVMFTEQSLKAITVPALIYAAEKDRWLPPRFHAAWIGQNIPGAAYRVIPNAGHFAFMNTASVPIQTLDGDISDNPPGFDRTEFLKQLGEEIPAFFDRTLTLAPNGIKRGVSP
ncbi:MULTISPECIES: alpha/beta hydrolase family protein [Rhizobium]|uniref:Dienelactone hydrolase n=1 Tax=Rhizobium tropici TaxID=398 RepID=A0A6P1C7H4_RHITR|nr:MULTISPECIES: alpha/beta fold hydrolase [Rhizobium]AGB75268.1 putative dienelactone hydrolase [Rhizobium tropici CIAT 899]MBB4243926.1 putative dienelactone hydrolase [Rhizobium tropici]MBB5595002.1 putative dienelactone hydrolase [Rhizobium tropici]MBB6494266.1 putative dienelactone hydrolase [Rhizobium tropici]NEV12391.1 dienelactone hydrolase [Rhizobium tropici]